jgi:hypothetical protein
MSASAETERDERLAGLLAELTEGARRGKTADLDAVASAHPDLEVPNLKTLAELTENREL